MRIKTEKTLEKLFTDFVNSTGPCIGECVTPSLKVVDVSDGEDGWDYVIHVDNVSGGYAGCFHKPLKGTKWSWKGFSPEG